MKKGYVFDSDLHKSILTSKYCHTKRDKSKESFDEAIERVAINVNKYDKKLKNKMVEDTIEFITNKEFAPAGGIWRAAGNTKKNISHINCTTQEPVKDNIEHIFGQSIKDWARIASFGQGNGIDISGLRPKEATVNNCAKTSSGAVSFLHNYDSVIKVIGQDARRGATKPDMWIYHPDSREFITCKNDINQLTTQNISIKVDSEFMEAVKNNKEIELKWIRKNDKVYVGNKLFDGDSPGPNLSFFKKVKAVDLFNEIALSAWKTGEPGIEFWDISQKLSNSDYCPDKKYHIVSTNACSEQKLDPYNTCILSSINLFKMPKQNENWKDWLKKRVEFGIRFLDNVVVCEIKEERYANEKQHQKMIDMTRIGLGFTGLADYFFKCGIVYGSKESIDLLEEIMKVFAVNSYRTSISLGKERGSFKKFKKEWFIKSEFIKGLCDSTDLKLSEFTHLRHVACMSIAPTGTLSMIVGVDGSGIEPFFAPYFFRKERATTADGEFKEHCVMSNRIKDILNVSKLTHSKDNADKSIENMKEYVTVNDINPMDKMELMRVIYKYIDSGISVTYNLPNDATVEDIKKIYMKAYELKLKSVTVYRDGSRQGVLTTTSSGKVESINKHDAPKRPKELPCDVYRNTVDGVKYIVLIGKVNDEPYEIFCGLADKLDIPKDIKEGFIVKNKRGDYKFVSEHIEEDITKSYLAQASRSALTRMISISLRHGVDVSYICQQIEKSYGDMTSFSKVLARVLKKYIKEGTKVTGETCPTCKSDNLLRMSGCVSCSDCGWSKC